MRGFSGRLRDHRGKLLLLLVLIAGGGGLSWWLPVQPRTAWELPNLYPESSSPAEKPYFHPGEKIHFSAADLCFAPGGQTFSTLSYKGTVSKSGNVKGDGPMGPVRIWDLATGEERLRLCEEEKELTAHRFSPDSRWLATEDPKGGLKVFDQTTGKKRAALRTTPDGQRRAPAFFNFRFSPDSRVLAFEQEDGKAVKLWDVASGQIRATLKGACRPFEFASDSCTLATATNSTFAKLWDVATGQERAVLPGHSFKVGAVGYSPDGKLLASGLVSLDAPYRESTPSEVKLWDASSGEVRATLAVEAKHDMSWHGIVFSSNSKMLLVPSMSGSALWDLTTTPVRALDQYIFKHPITVEGKIYYRPDARPAFSPDGTRLAIGGEEKGTVELRDTATMARKVVLKPRHSKDYPVYPLFSPDGQTLVIEVFFDVPNYQPGLNGWLDRLLLRPPGMRTKSVVQLFDGVTGGELTALQGSDGGYHCMGAFAPDSKTIITITSTERPPPNQYEYVTTVKQWDVPSGLPIGQIICLSAVGGMVVVLSGWWHSSRMNKSAEKSSTGGSLRDS